MLYLLSTNRQIVSQVIQLSAEVMVGTPAEADWKRPSRTSLQQIQEDTQPGLYVGLEPLSSLALTINCGGH